MTCPHCVSAGRVFGERVARRDLRRYRRSGPASTTRHLLEVLCARGVEGAHVLDVGGGVGALQHGLLAGGAASVLNVDAAAAYQAAAREEAIRRGTLPRFEFLTGDLVEMAPELGEKDVVTLDRVLCCYPDVDALVDASASRARRFWGVVFPRERRLMRLGVGVLNLIQRLRRDPFRVYVHATGRVVERARLHGLRPVHHARSFLWQIWLFERLPGGNPGFSSTGPGVSGAGTTG